MDFYTPNQNFVLFPCFFAFTLTIHLCVKKYRKSKSNSIISLPPSPSPTLPLFGNLFCLGNSLHRSLAELAKIHGPIMFLKLGRLPTVVISSASVAKEALQKNDLTFSNRTVVDVVRALDHHHNSFVFLPPTPKWRNLRKICNSHIFSARKLEDSRGVRENKVTDLRKYVQKRAESRTVVDIGQAGYTVVLNVLSTTFFSLDLDDPAFEQPCTFRDIFQDIIEEMGKPNVADFFPILKRMDLQGIKRRTGVHFQKIFDRFNSIIEERVNKRTSHSYVRYNDVLDVLLDLKEEDAEYIEPSAIPHLLLDLIAGTNTTSNSFEWAMAELFHNPDKLEKLRAELEEVIGNGIPIQESHIGRLPYLRAVVKETLRLHPAAPIPAPRKVNSDVNMFGYTVPANSMVLVNVWAIARDSEFWDKPETFEPERFLRSEIDVKGCDFELIPFGAGRRICPGMLLAVRVLPLMIGALVHEFGWKLEDGVTPENMNMDEKRGFTAEKTKPLRAIPLCR